MPKLSFFSIQEVILPGLFFMALNLWAQSTPECKKFQEAVTALSRGIEFEGISDLSHQGMSVIVEAQLAKQGDNLVLKRQIKETQYFFKISPKNGSKPLLLRLEKDDSIQPTPQHPYATELVSPILNSEQDLLDYLNILNILKKNLKAEPKSASVHFHVDASNLTDQQRRAVFKNFQAAEDLVLQAFPSNAKRAWYAKPVKGLNLEDLKPETLGGLRRYYSLNMQSLTKHGTFEFRFLDSTTDAIIIKAVSDFLHDFVVFAVSNTNPKKLEAAKSFDELLTIMNYKNAQELLKASKIYKNPVDAPKGETGLITRSQNIALIGIALVLSLPKQFSKEEP